MKALIVIVVVSLATKAEPEEKIRDLVWRRSGDRKKSSGAESEAIENPAEESGS